jgi:rRNA maturation endonuclease Nob1
MAKLALRCDACRYKFSRTHIPNLCPFCGKRAVVEDTGSSAEQLLREVDEMERVMSARKP